MIIFYYNFEVNLLVYFEVVVKYYQILNYPLLSLQISHDRLQIKLCDSCDSVYAQTKCLSAQPVTVERYPPFGDTKLVNHSTDASSFTCSVGKKFHCEAKDNTQVILF